MSAINPWLGDDYLKWLDQWEQAQKDGTFKDAPKPPNVTPQYEVSDFFGNYRPKEGSALNDCDAEYWRQVYALSGCAGDAPDILTEGKKLPPDTEKPEVGGKPGKTPKVEDMKTGASKGKKVKLDDPVEPDEDGDDGKAAVGKKAKKLADSPNPIYPDTYGMDKGLKKTKVSGGWAAGDKRFKQVEEMKIDLYDLECQMHGKDGYSEEKAKSVQAKIERLKKKIEELSDEFSGDWVDDRN
jgi:hypothetical protein